MSSDVRPEWLTGPMGQALLASETAAVEEALSQVFGLHLLQIGSWGQPDQFIRFARTQRQALVATDGVPGLSARSRPSRLGIASDSVDAVLLPHTLETDSQPHEVLREVERVLVGEGHLIVIGFNPLSAWGARHLALRRRFPRGTRQLIPEGRMRDWLSLLGMKVEPAIRCGHCAPVDQESVLNRLKWFERAGARYWPRLSGVYVLVARKRVYSVTAMRPQWSRRPRVAGGLVEPTTRSAA
ncbi:MAG: methyltransferase domain-containing protein [Gammaproteobacteria bacterium]|nr:methyltransferase domain-containing protein [Gammaproteobacteria bacterium]NNM20070.1 methyltransferase domain-containing protein [Gammaproteobacteria bacterium]